MLVGKHPLYRTGDDTYAYVERLKNISWSFPCGNFSELAKEFFLKLVKVNPLERYTAKEALEHPWITRITGKIPLSYAENIAYGKFKGKLLNV